jgi:chondroitin 4-sulfotransferase 11
MSLFNRKALFVHINKSCGGIITIHLNNPRNGISELFGFHRTLNDMLILSEKVCNVKPEDLFKFTIVRNPWARMLSMYLYYKKHNAREFFSGIAEIDDDFNNWIEFIYSDKFRRDTVHSAVNIFKYCFCNQLNWLKDIDGKIIDDINIYKIEELDIHDLLANKLEIKHLNIHTYHPTEHGHYSEYYTDKTRELVQKHYQEDIDYFGYKFETC